MIANSLYVRVPRKKAIYALRILNQRFNTSFKEIVDMKIFVGSLSWGTDDDGLRQAFERFGEIEYVRVITDRETGRSRGFGFVTFTNREDALVAISEMDNTELDGRTIRVNEAKEREPRGNRSNPRYDNRW